MRYRWWVIAIQIVIWCLCVPPLLMSIIIHVPWPIFSSAVVLIGILTVGYLLNFGPERTVSRKIARIFIYATCMSAAAGAACFVSFWVVVIYSSVVKGNPF